METITILAVLSSSAATNASLMTPDTHVQNAILSTEDMSKVQCLHQISKASLPKSLEDIGESLSVIEE